MKIAKRYIFHGHAVGIAAHIRHPQDRILPITASVALPVTGGFGSSVAGKTALDDLITFDEATANVAGDYIDGDKADAQLCGKLPDAVLPVRIVASASVTNLVYMNRVRAGKLSAQIVAEHAAPDQPRISFYETPAPFVDLSIDGYAVHVELEPMLNQFNSLAALDSEFRRNADFRKSFGARCETTNVKRSWFRPNSLPLAEGRLLTTIVKSVAWSDRGNPDAKINGNQITVDGFGDIFLGEMVIDKHSRRLTLLRIVMCGDNRCLSAGEVGAPGTPWT